MASLVKAVETSEYTVDILEYERRYLVLVGERHDKNPELAQIGLDMGLAFTFRAHEGCDDSITWGGKLATRFPILKKENPGWRGSTIAEIEKHQLLLDKYGDDDPKINEIRAKYMEWEDKVALIAKTSVFGEKVREGFWYMARTALESFQPHLKSLAQQYNLYSKTKEELASLKIPLNLPLDILKQDPVSFFSDPIPAKLILEYLSMSPTEFAQRVDVNDNALKKILKMKTLLRHC